MADWAQNSLVITGPREHVRALRDAVAGPNIFGEQSVLSPSRIVRPPDEFMGLDAKRGMPPGWSDWAIDAWGFDREIDASMAEEDLGSAGWQLTYTFQTAYFSAARLVKALIAQHPGVDVELRCVGTRLWSDHVQGSRGQVTLEEEFDEPATHEESVERTGRCRCDVYPISDGCLRAKGTERDLSAEVIDLAVRLSDLGGLEIDVAFDYAQDCLRRSLNEYQMEAVTRLFAEWLGSFDELLDTVEALEA